MAEAPQPAAVILREPEQLAFPALAAALARRRGCPALDALPEARACWGILAENQAPAAAQELAAFLSAQGFAAAAVPQAALATLPPAVAVVRAELHAGSAVFFTAPGEPQPAAGAALLGAAIIKRSVTRTIKVQKDISLGDKALQIGLFMATGLPIKTARMRKEEQKTLSSPELSGVLDIVRPPGLRLRVESENFDYSCLQAEKTYATLENFRLLARRMAALDPQAGRNRGLRFILEGRPQREMGYESAADLDRESRWLLALRGPSC